MDAPPLTTFRGFLKQIDAAGLNSYQQDAMRFGFPHFLSNSNFDETEVMRRARESLGPLFEDPRVSFTYTSQKSPNRRFSGGENLPRQRYYTLSPDRLGSDDLTLQSEMRAYRSASRSALCTVLDSRYPISSHVVGTFGAKVIDKQSMLLVFWGGPELPNPFLDHLKLSCAQQGIRPSNGDQRRELCSVCVPIPYRVIELEIPHVIDLRTLSAQDWLCRTVSHEGNCEVHLSFDNQLARFMEIGGGGFTEGLGRCLRRHAIQALIYPSARNDVSAIQEQGALSKATGWCLVDYRGAPHSEDGLMDFCEQTPFPFGKGTRVLAFTDPRKRGSWCTEGVRELYRYRFFMEVVTCAGQDNSWAMIKPMLDFEGETLDFERFPEGC